MDPGMAQYIGGRWWWVLIKNLWQFMMDFELKLQRPVRGGAYISSATMGIAYFVGLCLKKR